MIYLMQQKQMLKHTKEIESIYKKDEEKAKTEFESPVVKAIRSIFNGAGKYQPKEVIVKSIRILEEAKASFFDIRLEIW